MGSAPAWWQSLDKIEPIAGAFPIQAIERSRPTLAGRLLLWGLVLRVRGDPFTLRWVGERRHHAAILALNPLLCNRPNKEPRLLITAAQRLRCVLGLPSSL